MKNKFKFLALAIMALLSVNLAWGATDTWDLSKASHSSASADEVVWSGVGSSVTLGKGTSQTSANNYLGGTNAHTRIYAGHVLTFTPATGNTISSIVITATSSTYAGNFGNATKSNCTTSTSSSTCTVTPTDGTKACSLTIGTATRATQIVITYSSSVVTKIDVTLSRNGVTQTLSQQTAPYTLPAVASEEAACEGWVFDGWSTSSVSYTNTKPSYVTEATTSRTYYAVYRETIGSGGTEEFDFASIAAAKGWSNSFAYTPVTQGVITLKGNGGGNNAKYYTSDNTWRMYNGGTVEITSSAEGVSSVSSNPSKTFSISSGKATLSVSATTNFKSITVTYGNASSTYNSNPDCATCTAISPTLSYTATATVGQVLNPTLDKKGSSGAVTYSIKSGSSNASINASTGALTCSATGTVTVQATIAAAGDYCDGTATSNAITISEPSYTITATKNDASLGNVSLSGKVITATPNACVGYANPAYTVTSGSATVSQSGNNFTVTPSSNCTICINFDELKKDTYVDHLHDNATIEKCGSYPAPSLDDAAKVTEGNCDVVHYHFAGWVTSSISIGTPGVPSGMITAGTAMNANGRTYIAVWAKEE